MPYLPDIHASSIAKGDPEAQIDSLVRQLNEWSRLISNENITNVYNDDSGTARIIIGVLPDGTTGIAISKEGISVLDAFS
jgi:hypothetical protein